MNAASQVLIVDDDQMMLDSTARALLSLGYESATETDAAIALRLLEENLQIRVLVIDLRLKVGSEGAQIARQALAIRPDIRVLLTSGDPAALQFAGRDMPQDVELLPKPYRRHDLAARMSRFIDPDAATIGAGLK
jgi:DNA-binding NtrC family response regulator